MEDPGAAVVYGVERADVAEFYGGTSSMRFTGFKVVPSTTMAQVTVQGMLREETGTWETLAVVPLRGELKPQVDWQRLITPTPHRAPTLAVIENFYENPDAVRKFALESTEFVFSPDRHQGARTAVRYATTETRRKIERHLGVDIKKWDYGWNGSFQYCTKDCRVVVHADLQKFAAILFLTPNAPTEAGLSLYRHRATGARTVDDDKAAAKIFANGFFDLTPFDKMDSVGNVYNRMVIFDASMMHSASSYFGSSKEDGRLFQIFFFD